MATQTSEITSASLRRKVIGLLGGRPCAQSTAPRDAMALLILSMAIPSTAALWIVAVLIVAVLIVAVLTVAVLTVAVLIVPVLMVARKRSGAPKPPA